MVKKDPYAALRIKEFNIFLLVRFVLVFGWSMQFIVIEWEVYSLTKDPLSLGIIGLMEIIPALTMALFAGHIVDQGVVAEESATVSQEYVVVADRRNLPNRVNHLFGGHELPLLHIDAFAGLSGSNQQIRLSTEEGRYLNAINHLSNRCSFGRKILGNMPWSPGLKKDWMPLLKRWTIR